MKDKVKKELNKLLWSFCCLVGLIIALNWVTKSYTKDLEEKIAADVTAFETTEKDIKSLAKFSNGSAYLLATDESIGIISVDYTNTSGEVNSFGSHYKIQAYQNGIQLETPAYIANVGEEYKKRDNGNKNIKDGITLNIEKAFILENNEDNIEIEIYYYTNIYMSADDLIETINVKIAKSPYI